MVKPTTAEELNELGAKLGQEEVVEGVEAPEVQEEEINPFLANREEVTEEVVEDIIAAPEAAPEYTPTYSFKVKDVEYEFDDQLKGIVKDDDSEKYVRDLMERSKGLDSVKEHRDILISENKEFRTNTQAAKSEVEQYKNHLVSAEKLLDQGDELASLRHLGYTDAQIKNAAMRLVEDDPGTKAAYEAESRARVNNLHAETQNNQHSQELVQAQNQALKATIELETYKPEISSVQQFVDGKAGKPGAFVEEVINMGMNYETVYKKKLGVDFTAQTIVDLVANKYRPYIGIPTISEPAPGGQQTTNRIVAPSTNKTIPSPRSAGSPARKKPASLADLQKISDRLGQE